MSLPYRFSDAGGADEQAFLAVASYFQGRVSSGTDRPGRAPTPTNPRTSRPSYRRVRSNFLASASGSVTSTPPPLLRLRLTLPVSHQLRVLCHSKPASLRTFQMV